jgi:hypothetical protein
MWICRPRETDRHAISPLMRAATASYLSRWGTAKNDPLAL